MSKYLDNPPDDDQRITELWAWIATHANGAEGIMSADVQMPGMGTRHVPLIASKRATADHFGPLARQIQRAAMHQASRLTNIRLVRFVASE